MTAPTRFGEARLGDMIRLALSRMSEAGVSLGHGSEDLWQEACFLGLRALGLPFERLEACWSCRLTAAEEEELARLIERRVGERRPASYLLREAWLRGRRFYCDERAIIPRSLIAETLDDALPSLLDLARVTSVLDLCAGGGALAVLAALALPEAQVTAADISPEALAVAAVNRRDYRLEDRLELVRSDVFGGLAGRRFDLILCNPPYVTDAAMAALPPEYRHEPVLALAGGADGMDFMRRAMTELRDHLDPGGAAVFEIGDGRAAFEALWPDLPVTWLSVAAGDDLVFLVRAEDLPRG